MASLTVLAAGPAVVAAADNSKTRAAIEALEKKYDQALNKGNAAELAALYEDDARIFAPDHEIVKGSKAILAFWKEESAKAMEEPNESSPLEIEDYGDVATEMGAWKSRKANGELAEQGKYMVIWRQHGGGWKIHRETWNRDTPPAK